MKKVIVTGASGLLGGDIADTFEKSGYQVKRLMGRRDINLLSAQAVLECMKDFKPDFVIHAAGYRDLDELERCEREGFEANAMSTRNIALACRQIGCMLIYISSDTVFDGEKPSGYHEFDTPCPVNIYGRSKLAAEQTIQSLMDKFFIVRTAILFGYKGHRENNFIFHIVDELREGRSISASRDQVCCPTYTADLAKAIMRLAETEWYGIYHITNSGTASRYELSLKVAELAGLETKLVKEADSSAIKVARRAKNTTFHSIAWPAVFGDELPSWQDALARCMEEYKNMA